MSIPDWLTNPPETPELVWRWFLVIFIVYMFVRKIVARFRGGVASTSMARLSDAGAFAGSLLFVIGVFHHATLIAIGDTTGFLILGATGGLFYAGDQLLAERGDT